MNEATKYSPNVANKAMRIMPELFVENKVLKNCLDPASN